MSKKAKSKSDTRFPSRYFARLAQKNGITEFVLKSNGLRVLYVPMRKGEAVTTCMVYGVGSQHEGKHETGLAHMLEHMLFKDTGTKGPTWKSLEERGAILNATTWLDRTTYYFNLPSEYLPDMLAVETDRMRNLKLTKKEFEPERANVLSEYEMHFNDPQTVLDWNVVGTAFQSHGYHHDTIGFKSDIEHYTVEKLQSFYDRFYWPDNATVIVVGDVSKNTLLREIYKTFGSLPGRKVGQTTVSVPEMAQEGIRRVDLLRNTPIRALTLAWKAPSFTERDWVALHLGLQHLTDGKTSVLHRALVDRGYATAVTGSLYPTRDPFLAFLNITATKSASYNNIERIILRAIGIVAKKGIPPGRVKELISHVHASELFSRDGTLKTASQLAEYVASGNWKRFDEGLDELLSITPEEIQQAFKKYLIKSQCTVGTINSNDDS